jgi:DNA modification methylase
VTQNGTITKTCEVKLSKLTVHPRSNPRMISPARLEQLQRTLTAERDMLQARPVIALKDGTVIAGNQRLLAAQALGWDTIPATFVDLDDERATRWMLLDNRAFGDDDLDAAAVLLAELEGQGSDLDLTGFAADEIDELLRSLRPAKDPDEAPPLAAGEPRSKRGEVYELGSHRLMCGDCTDAADVALLLNGGTPQLCVTDPPYGVNYDPKWRNVEAAKGNLAYAARRVGEVANDDRSDWRAAWELFCGDVIYSWHPAGATSLVHAAALQDSGFNLRMQIIWAKSNFPIGCGDYHVRHEPCWYAVRNGKSARRTKDRTQTTLWEINLDQNVAGGHSTQKPVECMARPIRNHDFAEVYEPFAGTGTTLIAAEMLGRVCFAMELEPRYCDVIRDRYEAFVAD